MSSKRQHGKLQNIHTRIPIKDYQTIQLICNQLKISQAEYFNSCIHQFGYERLLLYARKINREPRPCRVDISEPASEEICHLTKAMNAQAEQIRKIGVNVSALIRDIRSGSVQGCSAQSLRTLDEMKSALDTALAEGHKNGARLAAILHDDNAIAKVEINYKNCWGEIEYREVKPCTHG